MASSMSRTMMLHSAVLRSSVVAGPSSSSSRILAQSFAGSKNGLRLMSSSSASKSSSSPDLRTAASDARPGSAAKQVEQSSGGSLVGGRVGVIAPSQALTEDWAIQHEYPDYSKGPSALDKASRLFFFTEILRGMWVV